MSASGVLASLRPSTYRKGTPRPFVRYLLDGHFEHPVKRDSCCAVSADLRQFLIRRVCLKLLNNFKKLANAFLFCQGNKPRWVDVAEAAAESHEAGGRFLDFHHA